MEGAEQSRAERRDDANPHPTIQLGFREAKSERREGEWRKVGCDIIEYVNCKKESKKLRERERERERMSKRKKVKYK